MIGTETSPRSYAPPTGPDLFLMDAASLLAASLDYDETLSAVAQLAVRFLADFCVIDVLDGDQLRRVRVAHADPARTALTEELLRFPLDRSLPHMSVQVLETGAPLLIPEVTGAILDTITQGPEHRRIVEALDPRSVMAVPLRGGGGVAGVALFVSSTLSYGLDDLALAEKLGLLAGLEVDNAKHYRDAREALMGRERILGVVAHDLRSPLTTIVMSAELLRDLPLSEEQRAQQLEVIINSGRRMNRLIQDLLDVARIESDRLQLERSSQEPESLVRDAVELNAVRAAAKSLRLEHGAAVGTHLVCADRHRLLQVLSNLIDNAIKFTPEGGRIMVSVDEVDGQVRFSVEDTGPGIPADAIPHLFRSFWQAPMASLDGAGLGLAIARGIVEAHGGVIWAESAPGRGSAFRFTVPSSPYAHCEMPCDPGSGSVPGG